MGSEVNKPDADGWVNPWTGPLPTLFQAGQMLGRIQNLESQLAEARAAGEVTLSELTKQAAARGWREDNDTGLTAYGFIMLSLERSETALDHFHDVWAFVCGLHNDAERHKIGANWNQWLDEAYNGARDFAFDTHDENAARRARRN